MAPERDSAADERDSAAEERRIAAERREQLADERDSAAEERGTVADDREAAAEERDSAAELRDPRTGAPGSASRQRDSVADERDSAADERETAAEERGSAARKRDSVADERDSVADEREAAAGERDSAAQQRELDYARSVLESAPDAMVIVNPRAFIQLANAETDRMFGYRRDELVGRSVEMLFPVRSHDPHSEGRAGFFSALRTRDAVGETFELTGCRRDGGEFAVEIGLSALDSEQGLLAVAAIRDVTEWREAAEFRQAVMDNMADGLYVVDGEGRLTYMNHAAERMLGFSEDELRGKPMHEAVHYQHVDGSAFPTEECELEQLHSAGRPVRKLEDSFTRKDGTILPTAYSAAPLGAGASGYGAVVVFRDATEERAEQTRAQRELNVLTWVGRVRDALDEDRLVLHAQPILPLRDGEPGAELLVRMIGQSGELIPPGSFLPAAEEYGLIGEIDRWVIAQAVLLAAEGPRVVHANLSAHSIIDPDLLPVIETALGNTNADPSRLVFEITETALMGNVEAGEVFAHRVTDLGCRLALDDFGTGFGSFTYLKRLPINYLKIDIDFVRDLHSSEANQHLVKGIVNLAKGFGHETIAEGVEDAETLRLLREYEVDFAQGLQIGPAAPITDASG